MSRIRVGAILCTGLVAAALSSGEVEAAGGSSCISSTCSAGAPPLCGASFGVDNCGNACRDSYVPTQCNAAAAACDETTYGQNECGGSCSNSGGSCSSGGGGGNWSYWGYAMPGDPEYGMMYPDPDEQDLVGFAAKGNVVIGDYTSNKFQTETVPILQPYSASNTQGRTVDYAIDDTDAELGYHSFSQGGLKMFDGNYNAYDGGYKMTTDGTPVLDGNGEPVPRKFYESSLSDAAFQALVAPNQVHTIEGVLFTNHALAGATSADELQIHGAMVSRDDALVFGGELTVNYDIRLLDTDHDQGSHITMPYGIERPELTKWEECPAEGCPPLNP